MLAVGYFTTARRGDDGALTAAGTLSVTDLQVSDCFSTDGATELSDVEYRRLSDLLKHARKHGSD